MILRLQQLVLLLFLGKTFFTRHVAGTSGRAVANDITLPVQIPAPNSCCASSQETTFPEKTTFAARASSTRRLEDEHYFESYCT